MAKTPAFMWYPKDCDTDENVRAMDDAEFGFYVRCLNHAWLNHGLPTDISEFARIMGKTPRQFLRLWVRVSRCFFENSEKRFVNFRQEQQREEQETFRKSRVEAAKSKWANKIDMHVHSKTPAEPMHVECSALAFAIASPIKPIPPKPPEEIRTPKNGALEKDPLDDSISETSQRMFDRHPAARRCSVNAVAKCLRVILKNYAQKFGKTKPELLALIDRNHAGICSSEDWTKDDGQYSKSLENWLSPSKERYMQAAEDRLFSASRQKSWADSTPEERRLMPGHMNPALVGSGAW